MPVGIDDRHVAGRIVGKYANWLILGFHLAFLQSITFISRLNALDYAKFRS